MSGQALYARRPMPCSRNASVTMIFNDSEPEIAVVRIH